MNLPFFCHPHFFPSPPKSWHLPSYANDAAIQLARGNHRTFQSRNPPSRTLEFIDIEALESDGEAVSDGGASFSSSSSITSSSSEHTDSSVTLFSTDPSDSNHLM